MPPRVSVIVPPMIDGSRLLLLSLDRQTMPTAEFEVLVGDDETDERLTARLEDLSRHRPNLRRVVVSADADEAVATLLERAAGEYVLGLPRQRRLNPRALETLLARAEATGADVVAGLTARAGHRPADPAIGGASTAGRMRRRHGLDVSRLAADLRKEPSDDDAVPTAPVLFIDGAAKVRKPPAELGAPGVRVVSLRWDDGAAEVVAVLAAADGDPRVSIYSPRLGVDWPVPSTSRPTPDGAELTFRITPESIPGYGPLPDGLWWPSVRTGTGPGTVRLFEVSPADARGATLGGRTVVSFAESGRLGIDVSGGSHQPIDHLDPEATTVVEDARGSLLTSRLTNIDLVDGTSVSGYLRLGDLPVVARVDRVEPDGIVLRAWVSGLAGTASLATSFSSAPFAPAGVQLVIDGVGAMSITPEPDPGSDPAEQGLARRALRRAARSVNR